MEKYVVVVAGGKGLRMGGEIPKQFQLLGDKPVIMHTLECFYRTLPSAQLILVLPQEQHDYWKVLCYDFNFTVPCRVVAGGSSRFASVKNGLALIEDKASLVAIHDGVRPFVARRVIEEGFEKALTHPAVIPVVEVVDTLRQTDGEDSFTVDRKAFKRVQTPQVFQTTVLCKAYEQEESPFFTDDASVVEAMEVPIHLFEGNLENIKLTTPFDWKVAQAIL
jgi:2-C-methyl-D-erythritol 4-phosphate cytidylyltransferase